MKLKKMFCTLAAVVLANMAFAGNSSDLKVLIVQLFAPIEQAEQLVTNLSPEEEKMLHTLKALKAGLLTYEANLTNNTMTATDQAIDTALTSTIPAIFNKIQSSSDEVAEEMEPVLTKLTQNVLANQTQFKEEQLDAQSAQGVMMIFSFFKAETDGVLLGKVSRIIQQEFMQTLQELIPQE